MNVLVLTHRLPYAPNRGDRVRAHHIVRLLAARADVHVVSLVHDREEAGHADTLRQLGVKVSIAPVPRLRNLLSAAAALPTELPLTHALLHSPGMATAIEAATRRETPDVVLAYCTGVAPLALTPPLAGVPLVLDIVDVDSAKWAAFADASRFPRAWIYRREATRLAAFERRAVRASIAATVVNERERDTLLRSCRDAEVHVVPNGVDVSALTPHAPPASEERVIFTAVFDYAPNTEGALWFARRVWPLVRAVRPAAMLTLAGASPTRAVRQLAALDPSIEVTGAVPDMRPYLWRSAVAVAPLHQARGVQNKVLEAAAAGLPAVITSPVWQGLPKEVLSACRRADTPEQFALQVIELLSLPPHARRGIAALARLGHLSWPKRLAPLVDLVERAARSGAEARAAVVQSV
ncbi:MAG TPA: TIGR03087 family PEP-CTERM/XrtA system glycosyltransferase [Vicinamibacterales bacterium]|nr:TIGR03087 family PEP-CTERM/XrtA system glycosyltransferase [Vicinamibacterales bacterium]